MRLYLVDATSGVEQLHYLLQAPNREMTVLFNATQNLTNLKILISSISFSLLNTLALVGISNQWEAYFLFSKKYPEMILLLRT